MCKSLKAIVVIFFVATCLMHYSYATDLKLLYDDVNQPVLVTHANDARIFIVEKTGKIFAFSGVKKQLFLNQGHALSNYHKLFVNHVSPYKSLRFD